VTFVGGRCPAARLRHTGALRPVYPGEAMTISNVSSGETAQPVPEGRRRIAVAAAWGTTLLFSALMTASGGMLLAGPARLMEVMGALGYPLYFLKFLALAKLLGVLALVVPVPRTLREWAYAGFTFDLIAAIVSHVATGTPSQAGGPVAILVLLLTSYGLRKGLNAQ
jgi:hypothetical protein